VHATKATTRRHEDPRFAHGHAPGRQLTHGRAGIARIEARVDERD
jgi:hypothetical protein